MPQISTSHTSESHSASQEISSESVGVLDSIQRTGKTPNPEASTSLAMNAPGQIRSMADIQEKQLAANPDKNPLCAAIASNDTREVARLAADKLLLNRPDSDGITPIIKAIQLDNIYALGVLIKNEVDMNQEALVHGQKVAPLIYATASENIDAIKILISCGADVNKVGSMGINAMHSAVFGSSQDVLKCLLENKKVNVNVPTLDPSLTPLHIAVMLNKEQASQKMINSGRVDISKQNMHGQAPVVFSILSGNKTLVDALLKKDADLTSKDIYGRTPLAFALLMGDDEITKKITIKMKAKHILNDLDLYRALAKLDENPAIENFILSKKRAVVVGNKRTSKSIASTLQDNERKNKKRKIIVSFISISKVSSSEKVHVGGARTISGAQAAPPIYPVEFSEAGPSSGPITSSIETQTLPVEIFKTGTMEQVFSKLATLQTSQSTLTDEVKLFRQEATATFDVQKCTINRLEADFKEHKTDTRQALNEMGKQIDGGLAHIRALDARVNTLEMRTTKIEQTLRSYFGDIPKNLSSNQREYFRSFLLILNQRFLIASAIDSGQVSVSSNAVSNIDSASIGMSIVGNATSLANAASDVAGGIAVAGSIAGGIKALVNHCVTNYASNHSESISHFFSTPQRCTLLSFDLAKSLIPKISKEIGDAKRSQRAKDNQQSNPLTKRLNSFRKAARKCHFTAGSLQEVTSNEAIFKLADKHINTLAAEIHNLKFRDNDKFLALAYGISEGNYSNAITWSENTII